MDITVESVTQLLGQKELELHLLRERVAALEAELSQYPRTGIDSGNTPQRPDEK